MNVQNKKEILNSLLREFVSTNDINEKKKIKNRIDIVRFQKDMTGTRKINTVRLQKDMTGTRKMNDKKIEVLEPQEPQEQKEEEETEESKQIQIERQNSKKNKLEKYRRKITYFIQCRSKLLKLEVNSYIAHTIEICNQEIQKYNKLIVNLGQ
jgi:hypothetical protein